MEMNCNQDASNQAMEVIKNQAEKYNVMRILSQKYDETQKQI